jgi:hypothetical protein
MSKEQYDRQEKLQAELNETLKAAFLTGDPAGELAQKACELHSISCFHAACIRVSVGNYSYPFGSYQCKQYR